jgi:filamentous hemagglutinin
MMNYLPEAARITEPGGQIVINGNGANPYFKNLPTTAQLSQLELEIQYQGPLLPEYQGLSFARTDRSPIPNNTMRSIVLVKKGGLQ